MNNNNNTNPYHNIPVYDYCNRCAKPIDTEPKSNESDNTIGFCSTCAAELLKKIYGTM